MDLAGSAGATGPALVPQATSSLTIPADDQLAAILAGARGAGQLRDLRQIVAAWETIAQKCDLAFEEMVRLAVFRLEVERELGRELSQTVRRGGDRSKSPGMTLLPNGISKNQSAAYQKLAAISEESFRAYLLRARNERRIPSAAGARRFGAPHAPQKRRKSGPASPRVEVAALPSSAVDAIRRFMTLDAVVGDVAIDAKRRLSPADDGVLGVLVGDVLVAECPDPAGWLPALRRLRNKGRIQQVVVVLPAEVWQDWFRLLCADEWTCCFLEGARSGAGLGLVIAHQGARSGAFSVALEPIGVVMRAR